METLRHDIRQTIRMMIANKAFTAAALLTLALGIGANAAVFSMVYGVLLRPLPYPEPERIVRVSEYHPGANSPLTAALISNYTLAAWLPTSKTLEGVSAYSGGNNYTVGRENPVRLEGSTVSPSLFRLLRVQPAVGRFFTDQEAVEGADGVIVLGHSLWQERYGSNPAAIGQMLVVEGRPREIIGVAPAGFAFPNPDTLFWMPYVLPKPSTDPKQPNMRVLAALGRLRPGVTPEQAITEGTAAARSVTRPFAADLLFGKGQPVAVRVRPYVEEMTAQLRPALIVLMAGVALVLFVACANVANLLLARGRAREREMAVRAALGAPWSRLARQLITESLLIGISGGALGLLLAWGLIRLVPVVAPENLPRVELIQLDWRVLSFSIVVSIAAGLLAGVLPAIRGAGTRLESSLREGDRRTAGRSGHAMRAGLLVIEAALAVVLIVGAGLLVRSFVRLTQVDGGFTPENVLTAQVFLPFANTPQSASQAPPFYDALLTRVGQMPGVRAVAIGNMAPFARSTAIQGFALPDPGPDGKPVMARATSWAVTHGYAAAVGLRLKRGRFLNEGDRTSATEAIVVNEAFEKEYLQNPSSAGRPIVGRRWVRFVRDPKMKRETEVVGVVANVLKDGFDREPQPEIYTAVGSQAYTMPAQVFLLIRTAGDPLAIAPELRRLVRDIDSRAALDGVGSLAGSLSASVAQPRFAALTLALFAALGLAVAATGLYGVLSYSVTERRREIGVRAALGATRGKVIGLVLRQGLAFTVAGLAVGLIAAAGASRFLSSLLFGVTPYDAVAFAIAPAVLIVVALAACLVPAWRAAAVDPAEALRAE
jgi:putative ABC transport system permease protein